MGNRNRVLSFISNFSTGGRDARSIPPSGSHSNKSGLSSQPILSRSATEPLVSTNLTTTEEEPASRPTSRQQFHFPPLIDVEQTTLPELQPIFSFLNSHSNKLYQEGYFLKLDDQNTQGRPNADRNWTECFAQLVGTVLSLWDAAELDVAGQDGEVLPKFINITDASIKMIESLPTKSDTNARLQNVLSISTAGKNRYLLHFNSHHSLIQWTAGIRLAIYEHVTLQEAYTGALIAGKGKALNNIKIIMDHSKSPTADWVRVRFGAGTPWRRCWCVISPPDEKELLKQQKLLKKKSPYDRSKAPILRGDIKFFDSKRTKKVEPIATISDAYSAFAIYPQSKPLIDASTLVKVEGSITIHSKPPSTTEGFVFVMPEVHPAVTGFEIMLRWLFPVFDTFGLYGRPGRLVAASEDVRSLMFAMPTHRRHGYLEILDVTGLILEPGSSNWKESQWRKRMKELTAKRMMAIEAGPRANSKLGSRGGAQSSLGQTRLRSVKFNDNGDEDEDEVSIKSTPSKSRAANATYHEIQGLRSRTDSAPPTAVSSNTLSCPPHHYSTSDIRSPESSQTQIPLSLDQIPSRSLSSSSGLGLGLMTEPKNSSGRISLEDEQLANATPVRELQELQSTKSPDPVAIPPAFSHAPGSMPSSKPYHSPELRRENSRISTNTMNQFTAGGEKGFYDRDFIKSLEKDERKKMDNTSGEREVLSALNKKQFQANDYELNKGGTETFKNKNISELRSSSSSPSTGLISLTSRSLQNKKLPLIPFEEHSADIKEDQSQTSVDSMSQSAPKYPCGTPPRKPLPEIPTASNSQTETYEEKEDSLSDLLEGQFIDPEAFDDLYYELPPSPVDTRHAFLKNDLSSFDDDDDSTDTPDYASTNKSARSSRLSVEKPRAGVMRTVGEPGTETSHGLEDLSTLEINFGPTYNYARPKSPGISKSLGISNNLGLVLKDFTSDFDPQPTSPSRASIYFNRSKTQEGKIVASDTSSGENRKVAWNPMMAGSGSLTAQQKGITPEDFVAQRASVVPIYTHQRLSSADALRTATTTPLSTKNSHGDRKSPKTHSRNGSTDFLGQFGHYRQSSADLLQRPSSSSASMALGSYNHLSHERIPRIGHSRGNSVDLLQRPKSRAASMAFGTSGNSSGNITSHLTAREQEHLAKVTGQPLISMATNSKNIPSAGLVAALEARERDKQALKQGFNSQAVEQAIQLRQHALHQQNHHQAPVDLRAHIHRRSNSQYLPQYMMQGLNASHPAATTSLPGAEWISPSPAPIMHIDRDRSPPSSHLQPQFLAMGRQQGRGNQRYGHGV
ncbi:hypothetical protein K3495_g6517 [Podosphaera aphanis]|nr:hypothetical protein K3495_g6517 [Podosphaera aphanis]